MARRPGHLTRSQVWMRERQMGHRLNPNITAMSPQHAIPALQQSSTQHMTPDSMLQLQALEPMLASILHASCRRRSALRWRSH